MLSHFIEEAGLSLGWFALGAAGIAVLSYCLGCLNGAVTVSKYILRDDVRNYGSGNGGLTNFCRVHGGPLTILVVLADVLKAVVAVVFAAWLAGTISPVLVTLAKYWAGLFCLLGHMFPFNFQFRGGKGVLSGGIIAILIDWRVALVVWGGFLILSLLTKYVSLGSIWAGLSFPFVTYFVFRDPLITILGTLCGGLLLWKHRANMKRLVTGKEPKFKLKKGLHMPNDALTASAPAEPAEEVSAEESVEEPAEESGEEPAAEEQQ